MADDQLDHPEALPPGGYVMLAVRDTGIGMADDVLARHHLTIVRHWEQEMARRVR